MNEKLFETIEEKYGQKYGVSWYIDGWGKRNIKIKNEYFEIFIPENIINKSDILINTFDNVYYYSTIESIVNAIIRIIKKINKENGGN